MEAVIHDVLLHYFVSAMVYVCAMTQNTLVVSFRWVHHVNGADMLDSGILDMSQNLCLHQKLCPFFFCLELLLLLFCLCGCREEGATRQNLTNYAHVIMKNGRGDHAHTDAPCSQPTRVFFRGKQVRPFFSVKIMAVRRL